MVVIVNDTVINAVNTTTFSSFPNKNKKRIIKRKIKTI